MTDAAELIEVGRDVAKMEEAAKAVKIYVMVTAEVGIEDVKQGMNGTEKDAKKSAREKVKDKRKKRGRESLSAAKHLGREELKRQTQEIIRDKENLHVRRVCI